MTAVRLLAWATLATGGVFPFGACGLLLGAHRRGRARLHAAGGAR